MSLDCRQRDATMSRKWMRPGYHRHGRRAVARRRQRRCGSMDRRRWIAGAACAVAGWPALGRAALRKPWPRQRATPAFRLVTLDGTPWTLAAERGHPVLLNFWASW